MKTAIWSATALAFLLVVSAAQTRPETPPRALLTFAASTGPYLRGLCTARPDGSALMRLTGERQPDITPAWSRDGKSVAFSRSTGHNSWRIVVANARGRPIRSVGRSDSDAQAPSWSPDTTRIAFFASFGGDGPIHVVDSRTGATLSRIGAGLDSTTDSPSWSPDGSRLVFRQARINGTSDIYSARADGSDQRLLVRNAFSPQLSGDGTKLAYIRGQALLVADADGTNEHVLVDEMSPYYRSSLAWSPDGARLAFTRANHKSGWIVVVRADTGRQVGIIKRRGWFFFYPAWRAPVSRPSPGRGPCG